MNHIEGIWEFRYGWNEFETGNDVIKEYSIFNQEWKFDINGWEMYKPIHFEHTG